MSSLYVHSIRDIFHERPWVQEDMYSVEVMSIYVSICMHTHTYMHKFIKLSIYLQIFFPCIGEMFGGYYRLEAKQSTKRCSWEKIWQENFLGKGPSTVDLWYNLNNIIIGYHKPYCDNLCFYKFTSNWSLHSYNCVFMQITLFISPHICMQYKEYLL